MLGLPPAEPLVMGTGANITGRGLLRGLSAKEASASAFCRATIFDGSASGPAMVFLNLASDESCRDWFAGAGIVYERGLFLSVATGSISLTCWTTPESLFEGGTFPSEWYEGTF